MQQLKIILWRNEVRTDTVPGDIGKTYEAVDIAVASELVTQKLLASCSRVFVLFLPVDDARDQRLCRQCCSSLETV